jgi:YesN/AraC family two-component response regulator
MTVEPIRVAVADDERVVRDGLAMMLRTHDGIEVVGTAADGVEAATLLAETAIDVLLLDVRMPSMDGLTLIRRLASGDLRVIGSPRIVVLTTSGTGCEPRPPATWH